MCEPSEKEYEIENKDALAEYSSEIKQKIDAAVSTANVKKLCHYTSAVALCSMLQGQPRQRENPHCRVMENGDVGMPIQPDESDEAEAKMREFWFTKWNCLNDPTEFLLIHKYIKEWIEKNKTEREYFCDMMSTCNAWEKYVKSNTTRDLWLFKHEYDVFVASFTQDDDLLNMWNGYAHATESDGYSITFTASPFVERNDNYEIQCASVIYDETTHRLIVNDLMELLYKAFESEALSTEGKADRDLIVCTLFGEIVSQIGGCLKHPAYKEEKEIRVLIRLTQEGRKLIKYRADAGAIIPYVPVEFDIDKITSIRISPMLNESWAIPGIRAIRNYNKLDFEIEKSQIPIRKV